MIEQISIRNFGNIAKADIDFGSDFTVITGETGAGKTMLLGALETLLGKPGNSKYPHNQSAQVIGIWRVPRHFENVLPCIEGKLTVSREISLSGKSVANVNGKTANNSYLGKLRNKLLVVHGQFAQVRLKNPALQRQILDGYAGNTDLLKEYQLAWSELSKTNLELRNIRDNLAGRRAEAIGLIQAVEEINEINPQIGEDENIKKQINILENHEQLLGNLRAAKQLLIDNGIIDKITELQQILCEMEGIKLQHAYGTAIDTALVTMQELSNEITKQIDTLPEDSTEILDEMHNRLGALRKLQKKYGPTIEDVIDFAKNALARSSTIENDDVRVQELEAKKEELQKNVEYLAKKLSERRVSAARLLGDSVSLNLPCLAMPEARFEVQVLQKSHDSYGMDQVAMFLRTSYAGAAQPIGTGASGGEISRVMLAIEIALASVKTVPTVIFDEIDSGVGGAAAIEIGRRLAALARRLQVIVITHSAQVAAFATTHLLVTKTGNLSDVCSLSGENRVGEMARLLSGLHDSESGLEHSRELLAMAAREMQGRT
ncbi:DNA repair protein RecN [Tropheryma whipplei]|uniref:DNA repair protein RecN n=1 Tax=Tropheryma whipplei TaxID=2039 RepID=UPI000000C795|nr:DNA repair protein RecN [Tropheryma whipplei]CAD66794.1 DNA repair protein RecN [Tropheryma whipplei TW08/27]